MDDKSANECAPDRGAFNTLTFNRCARGFTLSASSSFERNTHGPHFAFDKIEDVAAWLVGQYGPLPPPTAILPKPKAKARKTTRRRR